MISGLDREIVYAHGWAMSVVPVLDGFFSVGRGRDPPFDVILVFPLVNRASNFNPIYSVAIQSQYMIFYGTRKLLKLGFELLNFG